MTNQEKNITTKFQTIIDRHIINYKKALEHYDYAQEHMRLASSSAASAGYNYFLTNIRGFEDSKKQLKISVWRSLINATKLSVLMDSKTRTEMNDELQKKPPEITYENASNILFDLFERKNEILANSLLNVFTGLSGSYVSNDKLKLTNKRIILNNVVGVNGRYSNSDKLTDLDRFFHFIDNNKKFTAKNYSHTLGNIVSGMPYGSHNHLTKNVMKYLEEIKEETPDRTLEIDGNEIDTDYFFIRVFSNSNAHVYFKRKDLIVQCNRLIAYHNKNKIGHFRLAS